MMCMRDNRARAIVYITLIIIELTRYVSICFAPAFTDYEYEVFTFAIVNIDVCIVIAIIVLAAMRKFLIVYSCMIAMAVMLILDVASAWDLLVYDERTVMLFGLYMILSRFILFTILVVVIMRDDPEEQPIPDMIV